jgi:hypothetical protein
MTLHCRPHTVGEVHRQRLGRKPPQVRRAIKVRIRRVLECRTRQAEPFARRRRIS